MKTTKEDRDFWIKAMSMSSRQNPIAKLIPIAPPRKLPTVSALGAFRTYHAIIATNIEMSGQNSGWGDDVLLFC
jgi:hypothetical protein